MNWKPNKWIAAVLGFLAIPIGMLYVARPRWALAYGGGALTFGILSIVLLHRGLPASAIAIIELIPSLACAFHAHRFAKQSDERAMAPWYARWYSLAGIAIVLAGGIMGTRAFLFEPFRFPSGSMMPSIEPGSFLIVKKWGYGHYSAYGVSLGKAEISGDIKRGDTVVFEFPLDRSLTYAKRLIGLPGDKIAYRNKTLSINGKEVETRQLADYLHRQKLYYSLRYTEKLEDSEYEILVDREAPPYPREIEQYPFREKCTYDAVGLTCEIPPGHFFVMGDYRDASSDSRAWGFVPADHIVGRVVTVIPGFASH